MRKKIGVIFISLFCFAAATALLFATDETLASDMQEVTCVVGDANYDETFNVGDLVRLKRHLDTTELECSMDGDLDVSGDLASADVVRCREMLAGDKSLQVTVTEEDWYKELKDSDGYYAYYKLNKSLKEGWTLTFKVDFKENINCSVYGYYPGCDEWINIGEQSDGVFRLVAEEDIEYLNIRVANTDNLTTVSYFRVYDIQVYKSAQGGELNDLVITYNQSTDMPVVYGTGDTLDMTKFGVQTSAKDLSYKWTIKQTGVAGTTVSVDMTSTAYKFNVKGNYTLTATVNTEGYSGSVSTKIMVVEPIVYVGFDGGTVANIATADDSNKYTAGVYTMNATSNATTFSSYSGTVSYATGLGGDAGGAIVTNHYTGPYTVVKNYEFGTSNFTVSAWINVPKSAELSVNSTTYLFGTMNPDGTDGFAVSLKEGELRVKVLGNAANMPAISFERDSWYNITVKREGTSFKFYFDGELVREYTIDSAATFGTKDLSFGAYHGVSYAYKDAKMLYDDIQVYSGALGDETIVTLAGTDSVGPDVAIDFNDGKLKNTGMDQSFEVDKYYKLNALKSDTNKFEEYTGTVSYTTDASGESNGALVSHHRNGPNVVVNGYEFGADDFTVSTWFKVPSSSTIAKSGNFIFGISHPDATVGFNAIIKYQDNLFQLRMRCNGATKKDQFYDFSDFEYDRWYHLAAVRDGETVRWYLDGVYTGKEHTSVATNYATADFAIGTQTGNYTFQNGNMYFDDVRIYNSAVATKYIKEIYDKAHAPQVHIDYTDSTVVNTGTDIDAVVGTYKMKEVKGVDDNMFVTEPAVPFTMGAAYDKGGAISTNHYDGTYTLVRDYVFGTDDFTVSAWIKIPEGADVSPGSGTYLFGNDHVDTTDGFALCLKPNQFRVKLAGRMMNTADVSEDAPTISIVKEQWYHVALTREGADVKVYFDGVLQGTVSDAIVADFDFGTADLSFGGCPNPYTFKDANTHFDEIKVYQGALTADEIAAVAETDLGSEELTYTDESALIETDTLFYMNNRTISGADPGCIYVTEGEYAGYYIAYIGFNNSTQVKCYKSKDLVSWTTADTEERCFSPDLDASWIAGYDSVTETYKSDIWAPEVYYEDGTYYLFYSATSDHDTDGYKCLGVATSTSPIGPFTDIGKPLFDGGVLASETSYEKAGFIDAHPFIDPVSGDKYLYMARNRDNHDANIISVVQMKDWCTPDYSTYQELTTVDKTTYDGSVTTERAENGPAGSINEAPFVIYYNGTYYLTMSVSGTTGKDYTVIQATGDSPIGPFTKVQQSDGGVILGIDLDTNYAWEHISASGSHSFVRAGDEWFILYHTHSDPYNIGTGYVRSLALDRMVWTTNSKGQTIMKAAGPTTAVQAKPAAYSGYINLAPKATVTATNIASGSSARYLNDGVIRMLSTDDVKQFEGSGDVTITMKFDQFVKARSLMIYNSWKYGDAFEDVSSVTFTYGEVVDGVRHIGTKTLTNANFNMTEYSYVNDSGNTVMIPGSALVLTFDEMEIIEVSIDIPCAEGKSSVAISDIVLLGKALDEETDVHVSYSNGTMGYTSSDDAVTVGAKIISANGDANATFVDYAGAFKYLMGIAGDENGAIMTNHTYGPLTVVEGYDFGSNDFTVSTWFMVPEGETIQSSGNFIFGTADPDNKESEGFSACIKYTEKDGYQWRFKDGTTSGGKLVNISDFAFDTWYHVTVSREGSTLKWYVDGELLLTQTATEFTSTTLAVGAYAGWGPTYKNTDVCFDELKIYSSALSQNKITALTAVYKN